MFKLMNDLLPLIVFFISYKTGGIVMATKSVIVVTILGLVITYIITRNISLIHLFSGGLLILFGGLTIFTGNKDFIKFKPTVLNLLFAFILFGSILLRKNAMKYVLGEMVNLSEKNWQRITFRFAMFFMNLALLNEIIWRNFSDQTWVNFKVFVMPFFIVIFTLMQIPFFRRNQIEN